MDYGKDNYAMVTWSNAPNNRRTAIGWMSNWEYANDVPTQQYRSANTLPRELGLMRGSDGEVYLTSVPSPEIESLRTQTKSYTEKSKVSIPELCEIEVDYDLEKGNTLDLILSNSKGEKVMMTLNPEIQTFAMDRRESGTTNFSHHFPTITTAPTHKSDIKGKLRIFIDRCSIEAFDGNGAFVMTNLVFPTMPYDELQIIRGAEGVSLKIHTLNP